MMTAICMMFAFFIGKGSFNKITVPIFSELSDEEFAPFLDELNKSDLFAFENMSESDLKAAVQDGKADMALAHRGW